MNEPCGEIQNFDKAVFAFGAPREGGVSKFAVDNGDSTWNNDLELSLRLLSSFDIHNLTALSRLP